MFKNACLLLFCLLFISPLYSQKGNLGPRRITGFNFVTDQDYFWPGSSDRNYTMGATLNWYGPATGRKTFVLPIVLGHLDQLIWPSFMGEKSLKVSGFHFGYAAFTPDSLSLAKVVADDRPYSGPLVLQSSRTYRSAKDSTLALRTRFGVGLLGFGIGNAVQSSIHYLMAQRDSNGTPSYPPGRRPVPMGWDNQIADGFGLSFLYQADWLKNLVAKDYFQLTFKLTTSLGYYTRGAVGVEGRLGWFNRKWYFQDDVNGPINKGIADIEYIERWRRKLGLQEDIEGILKEHHEKLDTLSKTEKASPPYLPSVNWIPKRFELYLHYDLNFNAWLDNGLITGNSTSHFWDRPGALHYWQSKDAAKDQNQVMLNPFTCEAFLGVIFRINYFELGYGGYFRSADLVYVDESRGDFRDMIWGQLRFGWSF